MQASSYKDHAGTDKHKRVRLFLKQSSIECMPIAKALHNLDGDAVLKLKLVNVVKLKFDIGYIASSCNQYYYYVQILCDD